MLTGWYAVINNPVHIIAALRAIFGIRNLVRSAIHAMNNVQNIENRYGGAQSRNTIKVVKVVYPIVPKIICIKYAKAYVGAEHVRNMSPYTRSCQLRTCVQNFDQVSSSGAVSPRSRSTRSRTVSSSCWVDPLYFPDERT